LPVLDTVDGLPVHPLIVHAVVVLLPLAALGVVGIALRASWLARYGGLVIAFCALSVLAIPLATSSGEHLESRVGDPGEHAELGDTLIWFAIPLLVAAVALVWLHRRSGQGSTRSALRVVTAVVAVLIAGANVVQLYRIGDSGARAVWHTVATTKPTRHGD
jgi:hypothetical protein